MVRNALKILILFSLFALLSTGCAYNKKSLLDYDYPAVPQEYYGPYPYPYYYPYMTYPYPPYYYPYPPYFYPPYPFLYP